MSSLDDALLELGRLRHRHAEAVRRRERLVERVAWFPNGVNTRTLAELDEGRRQMEERMRELEDRVGLGR